MKIVFLNSRGHWRNGWLTSPEELQIVVNILEKAGIETAATELETVDQLERVLDGITPDTLLWPNAYFVNEADGRIVWLNEYIEARGLPFIGSNAKTLKTVLEKDACQAILRKSGLPIPDFTVITRENLPDMEALITERIGSFPVVLKPTAESGSVGVCLAHDMDQARGGAAGILDEFPHSNVIIEEFLPSDDITCGFVQLGDQVMLLPTAYLVKTAPGKSNILSRKERLRHWDDQDKIMPHISDAAIQDQLKAHIPQIAAALEIKGITRIDGRLDKNGALRFFDVNGLPALCFPDAVMVKQCFTCFPGYAPKEVFVGLIHTIVHHAILLYGMEVPKAIARRNLFTMESDLVIESNAAASRLPQASLEY
ncbi:MAG TPA: hypothetical protein PKE06_24810 [Flavilitoribacter sp.]|nr:hypothetical protein [Flavilitoribacter sp.]HMQ86628.1 hypothetical protein [Flavilitoribacter sp.]